MKLPNGAAALLRLVLFLALAVPLAAQDEDSLIVAAQRQAEAAETLPRQVESLTRYAELLSRAGRHAEALDVVSEAGQLISLPSAVDVRSSTLPDSLDRTLRIVLVRAAAEEGLSQFAEARNDYRAFLAVEPNSGTAAALRRRQDFVTRNAVADLATLARFDVDELARFYDPEAGRLRIGVLPFFNESDNLLWNFVGYGLTGYLNQAFALLRDMTDSPLQPVARSEVSSALNSVSLGRFYAEDNPIGPIQVAHILGSEFAISGSVSSGADGVGLAVRARIGRATGDSVVVLPAIEDSSLPEGIERVQVDLALSLADQLQTWTGFTYRDSRDAYADSLRRLIVPDLQRFVAYGRSVELSLAGEAGGAAQLLTNTPLPIARLDQGVIAEMLRSAQDPPLSLADVQEFIAARPTTTETPDDVAQSDRTRTRRSPRPRRQALDAETISRLAGLLGLSSQAALGASSVDDQTTGSGSATGRGPGDPRDGIEGVNRSQQAQITVQVVIPVPPAGSGSQN